MKKLIVALFGLMMTVVGGTVLADANFDFSVSPNTPTSISGEQAMFTIDMHNKTANVCTGYMQRNVDAGLENAVATPGPIAGVTGMFVLPAGSSQHVTVTADVQVWTWNDTFGIDVSGRYVCSGASASTGMSAYLGRVPEIVVDKKIDPAIGNPHNPGEPVHYIITLTNIGSEDATGFYFDDDLPPTDYFNWTMDYLAYFNGLQHDGIERIAQDLYRWEGSYLNVPAGGSMTIGIHGTLGDHAVIGTPLNNTGSISGLNQYYADQSNDSDNAIATVTNSDLSIVIETGGSNPMYDKDPLVWKITIANHGNMDASNVHIDGQFDDNLVYPAGSNYQFVSNNRLNYAQSQNGNVVWNNVSGAIGYSTSFILTGYLNTGVAHPGDFICFNASISSDIAERLVDNAYNNEDTLHNCYQVLDPLPAIDYIGFDLTLSSPLVDNGIVYGISGSVVDFNIAISNTGADALHGFVQCTFPGDDVMDVEPNTGSPITRSWTQGGNTVEMDNYVDIPSMGSVNLTFTGRITDQSWTYFPITCRLYSGDTTPFLVDSDTATIDPVPELVVDKTLGDNPSAPGDLVSFTTTVTNIGSAPALNYLFRDMPLPQSFFVFPQRWAMNFNGISHPYSEYGATVFEREGTYLNLNPGESMNIQSSLPLNDRAGIGLGDSFCNDAWVQGLALEYDTTNDIDHVCGIIASADLSLSIHAIGDEPEYQGDPVVFQIDYANNGNVTGDNALLRAIISNQVFGPDGGGQYILNSDLAWDPPVSLATGRALSWSSMAPIAPGVHGTIIVTGYLNADTYLPGQSICLSGNFWSEYSETLNTLGGDNVSEACHYVTGEIADLVVHKDLLTDLSTIEQGDPVTYRLSYGNIGNYTANDVLLVDIMPSALDINTSSYPGICSHTDHTISCHVGDVLAGDENSFVITGYLNVKPDMDISLTNTGEISFLGREFNTGNNSTGRTDIVPSLPDLYVYKTIVGDQPAVPGDTIRYQIDYGNSGGRTAYDVSLRDHILFSGLEFVESQPSLQNWDTTTNSGYRAHFDLFAGQTGRIVLTAQLNDWYDSGTLLPNEVWIDSTTMQTHTGNEYSIVTGAVQRHQEVMVFVDAENITHPERNTENPVWGVSGDLVSFTVRYNNSGNVNLHNAVVTLTFPATAGGFDNTYEWNIGDLPFGSGGSFVVTGIVGPQGFADVVGTARIWAQEFGIDPVDTHEDRIIEKPMRCGDGFMTEDEMCDITGTGTIGTVLPGQVCQSRGGVPAYGCEVVTEQIINTGCIEYGYYNNASYFTGGYCVDVSSHVAGASCESLTKIEEITQGLTGLDVQFLCEGTGTNDYSFITMDCGNGEYLTGLGAELTGTCHYTGSLDEATTFQGQCSVGNDTLNPACQMDVGINAPDQASCESLTPVASNVLVVDDNEHGSLQFACSATSGVVGNITIDCGNGQIFTEHGVSDMVATCDYIGSGTEFVSQVNCIVNDELLNDSCTQPAIVTPPYLGYCGDGKMDGYEQCDLGDNNVNIQNYLDVDQQREAGKYANAGYSCNNCAIVGGPTIYQPPACFNVNTNISVMKNEILPFRWNLDMNHNDLSDADGDSCKPGDINENTMECYFALYNGEYRQEDGRPLATFVRRCDDNSWGDGHLFDFFDDQMKEMYLSLAMKSPGKYLLHMSNDYWDDGYFGEYKLVLEKVTYQYCEKYNDNGETQTRRSEGTDIDRVCEVNYATTKPYLMQKSAFGATKVDEGIDLSEFHDIEGNSILDRTDLSKLMEINAQSFDSSSLPGLINSFVDKYEKLAVEVPQSEWKNLLSDYQGLEKVSVVPGRNIFVFEGNGALVLSQEDGDKYPATPYTIIVKNMDLYVQGNVRTNGMFIVDGKIGFQEKSAEDFCTRPQTVNGIFIAQKGFTKTEYNKNKRDYIGRFDSNNYLCEYGNLIVKGVLIGDHLDDLVWSRRSHLNDWFVIKDFATAEEERREKIFDGASVLIEYNPSLWSDLPPGAEDFTTALEVYKH